jgi:tetratricopeptide (TPR) repeat protein
MLFEQGVQAQKSGKPAEAEAIYRQIIEKDARNFDALHMLGLVCTDQEKFQEAEHFFQQAASIDQNFPPLYHNFGLHYSKRKLYEKAIALFDRALQIFPDYLPFHSDRGCALAEIGRLKEALDSHNRAVAMAQSDARAYSNRAQTYFKLRDYVGAVRDSDEALKHDPNYPNAWLGRGNALCILRRDGEALTAYDNALALKPDLPEAWGGRGTALCKLKRHDEAFAAFEKALDLKPDFAEAWNDRGNVFYELQRYDEALAAYERALTLKPGFADAMFGEAFIRLLLGDAVRGWSKYESRWDTHQHMAQRRDFTQPKWLGESSIAQKTILIHAEQGLGDTLMACRYTPMVAALGAKVILEIQPALLPLMQGLDGVSQLVATGAPLPPFDVHCPMMSLPLAFRTQMDTIPANTPYLKTPTDAVAGWRARLNGDGFKIGIGWAGNPDFRRDHDRSILLKNILPVCSVEGARFFSIQKDLRNGDREILQSNPRIVHMGGEIRDFRDTAAIMESLDLIISSDTSIVHLAGALGKPIWILLPFNPDWRWMLERGDSPWYPTARLFRQRSDGDWRSVTDEVVAELRKLIAGRSL